MPRNKVLEKAKVTMPSGRSAFDVSQIRSFDCNAGEINVAYCQPFVAGTKGKISRKCFTRTAQVVSPAFHSVTEHFDFFIVPIHSMWRYWENWKLNINDMQDTLTVQFNGYNGAPDLTLPANCPRADFDGLVKRTFGLGQNFTTNADAESYCHKANNALRLLDQLGYNELVGGEINNVSKVMNLFMLGAYQKCYFDHYRNTAYESNNPYAYNFDWMYDAHYGLLNPDADQTTPANTKDIAIAKELLTLRRVNYRNDYFHNIYPSLNYVQSVPNGIFSIPSNIGQLGAMADPLGSNPGVVVAQGSALQSGTNSVLRGGASANGVVPGTYGSAISVQSIRAAFALDKLMRASAYAPKHVREQYKALYGVDGVEDFDMKSERIGSFQSDVAFQEVTNMAESSSYELGTLGAKGVGGDDKSNSINFYCKYDSIVIGLHYFMPRARYDAYGLHPFNTKIVRESFYIKAFENLGLRPFYVYMVRGHAGSGQFGIVLGWTTPNFEYKILPDLNTGAFKRRYATYNVQNPSAGVYNGVYGLVTNGELSTYVPHNDTVVSWATTGVDADYFKVAPEDLDNVFKVATPPTHQKGFCQFFGEFRIFVPIVAPMSVHGQPSL